MSKLVSNQGSNWGAQRKDERKFNLAQAGAMAMASGSGMNRISSSERQNRNLGNNLANEYLYKKPATMKYGTSMLDHNPSEDEANQAGSALRLLKSKMNTGAPANNRAYDSSADKNRGYYDPNTHEYNQYAPGTKRMDQDRNYNDMYSNNNQNNYGKVFKPQFNDNDYGRPSAGNDLKVNTKAKALSRVNNYGDEYNSAPLYAKPNMGANSKVNPYDQGYDDYSSKNIPSKPPKTNNTMSATKGKVNQTVGANLYDDGYNNYSKPSSGPYSTKNSDNKNSNLVNRGANNRNYEPEEDKTFAKPVFKKNTPQQPARTQNSRPQQQQEYDIPIKGGNKTNAFDMALQEGGEFDDDDGPLSECPQGCGRSFNPKALAKHAKVCKKVFQTKRKEFDSSKARETDEQAQVARESKYNGKKGGKPPAKAAPAKASAAGGKWKQQSEAFRANLKAARGGTLTQSEQAAQKDDSDMVPCDFCGRKFNEKAAARHIPFCQDKAKKTNITKPAAKGKR